MIKMLGKKIKNKNGFTLIELIVVIAIIGILGSIAVPKFGGFRESVAKKADEATAAVLANATRLYYMDNDINDETTMSISKLQERNLLEGGEYKPQKSNETGFIITVTVDGNITVQYDGADKDDNLYPVQ